MYFQFLYVPVENEIQIYDRNSWTTCGSFQSSQFSGVSIIKNYSFNVCESCLIHEVKNLERINNWGINGCLLALTVELIIL